MISRLTLEANIEYSDRMQCRLCESHEEESQMHQLVCDTIMKECLELRENRTVKYDDFFGDISAQVAATKLYKIVLEVREKILKVIQ